MSILKSTNSGKCGIIKAHILGDKYEHQEGGNYYYRTPYNTQPPFYVFTYVKHEWQQPDEIHYAVNVNGVDTFSATIVKIETLDELKCIERYWEALIEAHDTLTTLIENSNCNEHLAQMLDAIKENGQKYINTTKNYRIGTRKRVKISFPEEYID